MSASGYIDRRTFFSGLNPKRIVVKTGTGVLEKDGKLNIDKVDEIAKVLSNLYKEGVEVYYVSSGAILGAMTKLKTNRTEFEKKYHNKKDRLRGLQLLSGVGQHRLMAAYESAFDNNDQLISQVLITKNDQPFYVDTVLRYAKNGVIPIINENDNLATDEITLGDNDNLAGMVATDLGADLLVILSDTMYHDKDPGKYDDATSLHEVYDITEKMIDDADSTGPWGTGGMKTKLTTAGDVTKNGIPVALLDGKSDSVEKLYKLLDGEEEIGTLFIPDNY